VNARPRIDLDGVPLTDEKNPHMVVAIFRYRTVEGLLLLIPESADVLVPWSAVESSSLDLATGGLVVRLAADYVAKENWLRGARVLTGRWLDRFTRS
jgi:hypothetical protein